LARSSAVRTALVYGTAGAAFALANLLLARVLPVDDYAVIALLLAFFNFGIPMGPLGADSVVNRTPTIVDSRLLARALTTALIVAGAATAIAAFAYALSATLLIMIFVAISAGGAGYLAAAHFQSQQRFVPSLGLIQGANVALLLGAVLVALRPAPSAITPLAVLTIWYVAGGMGAWWLLLQSSPARADARAAIDWREALTLAGVSGTTILLGQIERFAAPLLLDLTALATLGVLAAIVGSVFRILLLSVGYSLLPRLRAAPTAAARRKLVQQEGLAVAGLVLVASLGLWIITPWLVQWLLQGRYELSAPLIAAALAVGFIKVGSAFARTIVVALGSREHLGFLNRVGWVSVGLSLFGMWIGAQWGLTGLVLGAGAGWLALMGVAGVLAGRLIAGPTASGAR
jgi:hypothetical protein